MKFTQEELQFIHSILNQVNVAGKANLKTLIDLIERIEKEMSEAK